MLDDIRAPKGSLRLLILCAFALTLAACSGTSEMSSPKEMHFAAPRAHASGLDPQRRDVAVALAQEMRKHGKRVWCVPFARNVTGLQLRGNAGTWWNQANGVYERSHEPKVGAVMAFSATSKLPMGHVAVVSDVVSEREIRVDHANWNRNQVSLGMRVIDVSKKNDWSQVRVMSQPNTAGRVYPVSGFISDRG